MTEYITHDNGGRPFKVIINDNDVSVYNNETNEFLFEKNVEKVFIGKSPKNKMTTFSGGHGKKFDGNSILLKINDYTYQFIGESIFTFNTYEEIIDYVSPVGNNDVPYPYALDSVGNIYLLLEGVVLINTEQFKTLFEEYDDPYFYYYDHHTISDDAGRVPTKKALCNNINNLYYYHNIKNIKIGDELYTLNYSPTPEERYEDNEIYMLIRNDGSEEVLSKEEYINLIDNYGQLMDFKKLLNKEMQINRLY